MSVSTFLGLASFGKLAGPNDDDGVDRMNHLYTVVVLVLFSFLGTGSQFIGNPMDCLMPPQFPYTYAGYAKAYCWIKNTYYIPLDESIPVDILEREGAELTYYQWVPLILLFMALLFKLPCIFWRLLTKGYAVNLDKVTGMVMSLDIGPEEKRRDTTYLICQYLDRWLANRRRYGETVLERLRKRLLKMTCLFSGKREGNFLTGLYLVIKVLYCLNSVGQFFLLNMFLGDWYGLYGLEVLRDLALGKDLRQSARFPRLTLCDFQLRQLENIQRWTIQCVLPINMFNDKVFLFLWFWLCLVSAVNVLSLVVWVYRIFFRKGYVTSYLASLDKLKEDEDKKLAKRFSREYLQQDGAFLFRLVSKNTNDLLLSEVLVALFHFYKEKLKQEEKKKEAEQKKKEGEENEENKKKEEEKGEKKEGKEKDESKKEEKKEDENEEKKEEKGEKKTKKERNKEGGKKKEGNKKRKQEIKKKKKKNTNADEEDRDGIEGDGESKENKKTSADDDGKKDEEADEKETRGGEDGESGGDRKKDENNNNSEHGKKKQISKPTADEGKTSEQQTKWRKKTAEDQHTRNDDGNSDGNDDDDDDDNYEDADDGNDDDDDDDDEDQTKGDEEACADEKTKLLAH